MNGRSLNQRERVEAFAAQGFSPKTIAERTGIPRTSVRSYVKNWRKALTSNGLPVPPCRCGGPNNHQYSCPERTRAPSLRPAPDGFAEAARGRTANQLAGLFHADKERVRRWAKELGVKLITHGGAMRGGGRATSGIRDPLFGRIERLVPMFVAQDVRADIISDLYLAVLDGTIRDEDLEDQGGKIMSRTVRKCGASRFSMTVSLDEEIGEDGWTRGETLIDPAALQAFDNIFEEAL